MQNFIEKIDEDSDYTKVYDFIQKEFTLNEIFDERMVRARYCDRKKSSMDGRIFHANYRRAIMSLLQGDRIRQFPDTVGGNECYIVQQSEIEKDDKSSIQEKESTL